MDYTEKDLQRMIDIRNKPWSKRIGAASGMAKRITDVDKAERRYLASVSVFGSGDGVTTIFNERWWELRRMSTVPIVPASHVVRTVSREVVKNTVAVKVDVTFHHIGRSQDDFPIGSMVKYEGTIGEVIEHDVLNKEDVKVSFPDNTVTVNIYDLKRV